MSCQQPPYSWLIERIGIQIKKCSQYKSIKQKAVQCQLFVPEKDIELLKYMVVSNSWWDTIDYIATRGAGELIKKYPSLIKVMDEWSTHENMWLRRIAILHQMKYKNKTDTKRLFSYCMKNAMDKEFFIQKAMGWALREYAYVDANAVLDFVANHTLPNLTVREAKKHFK